MKGRMIFMIAAAIIALAGTERATLAVQGCPDANNCAEVKVDVGATGTVKPGDTFNVQLTFKQGPGGGQGGGIGEIAALALTLAIPGTGSGTPPLTLASCVLNSDNFPAGDVIPDPSVSNFKIVVENASCNGRPHCLCPDAGQTRDDFINLVIYGPNPLPTPGPDPIVIPILPAGPQPWVTLKLKVADGANGQIPLHIINQVSDSSRPQFTAFLSVGDKLAADQTCVPVTGQPPCNSTDSVSQVMTTDAGISVVTPTVPPCIGDCDHGGDVSAGELLKGLDILLGNIDPSACDAWDGDVTAGKLLTGLDNLLQGCP